MSRKAAAAALAAMALAGGASGELFGDLHDVSAWKVVFSPGVEMHLAAEDGVLRASYDFRGGAGWAGVRRPLDLDLPEDWALSFRLRGEGQPNTLEVKLVDGSGENVWWFREERFAPPAEWRTVRVKKRQMKFAWGPAGGGAIRRAAALEIVLSAGEGGKGFLELSDFELRERPSTRSELPPPRVAVSGGTVSLDFGEARELSGLVVDWEKEHIPSRWDVQVSDDGTSWSTVRRIGRGGAERAYVHLPETETRLLRLVLEGSEAGHPQIDVKPVEWAPTLNAFLEAIAKDSARGDFPRAFSGEQSYWTVVGVDGDGGPSLLGEDGALEPWKASFSIEPFVFVDGGVIRWSDVTSTQALEDGSLPIPTVTWRHPRVSLEVTAVSTGKRGNATLRIRYRLRNIGRDRLRGRFFLAVRPFQVNPPTQFLNAAGGVSPVKSLEWDGSVLTVNRERRLFPTPPPDTFGVRAFDEGPLLSALSRGDFTASKVLEDDSGLASGVLAWNLELGAGAVRDVEVTIPLHAASPRPDADRRSFDLARRDVARDWRRRLDAVRFTVPVEAHEVVDTLRANLAYILVTREGPALRPGARSYARSWIRDGALMSAALLRFGEGGAAKDFLSWFASYQFPDGRVPCCVDARGADPVAENDSHGELLFLAAEYLRLTGDVETVRSLWPRLERTVLAIEALRGGETRAEFRGLLPASISHEGYSAQPVHSFWDDFWAWKGLSDAADVAAALGRGEDAARIRALKQSFRSDVLAALTGTIARHSLQTLPGSVELHDFDPTATTVALDPCGLAKDLPRRELLATFDRYLEKVRARAKGGVEDAWTPYEIRSVGTFIRLGRREEALELLELFLKDRRPAGWRQWPEVVRRDPRLPGFLGDLPHTWVGSDFVRAATDLFAFIRTEDGAVVVGAGLPAAWLRSGPVGMEGLVTPWGRLSYLIRAGAKSTRVSIRAGGKPPGGFVVSWPFEGRPGRVTVDGRDVRVTGRDVVVPKAPSEVVFYR